MADTLPPAVPLDICLKNLYNNQGETIFDVDAAVKILQTIINNNGAEKFRSLNATKVLPRISPTSLQLWYILRHAGFYKDQDRLICPQNIPLQQIQNVLNKLQQTIVYNQKVRSGEIQITAHSPNNNSSTNMNNNNKTNNNNNNNDDNNNSDKMNDNTNNTNIPQNFEAPQQQANIQNTMSMDDETTTTTSIQQPTSPTMSTSASNDDSTSPKQGTYQGGGAVNLKDMTTEERKAYVAEKMRQKKASQNKQ